jgi:nucleotide sugar dehydrogenase
MASNGHCGEVMNIGVVGVGRLGICFALLLAKAGHRVIGSDIRTNYVAQLNRRQIQTNEPVVADMLSNSDKNLTFTTDTRELIQHSDVIYIMVATPSLADGSYDVSAVWRVVDDIKECDFNLTGKVLVVGCTTNPGDCQSMQDVLMDRGINVLYNPEFIAQGSIIRDLQQADMVLIGGGDENVIKKYALLYNDIQTTTPNVSTMSLTAAEIVKIAINCYLTTKISYANMLGEVLIKSGLENDVVPALEAVGLDSRVGLKYLKYGFGFGGPCLPRDNRAFGHYTNSLGMTFNLGATVDQFNQEHLQFLTDYYTKSNPDRLPFYIRSITYKPNTDILEESQQYKLASNLKSQGYTVLVEHNDKLPNEVLDQFTFCYKQELEQNGVKFLEITL